MIILQIAMFICAFVGGGVILGYLLRALWFWGQVFLLYCGMGGHILGIPYMLWVMFTLKWRNPCYPHKWRKRNVL